MTISETGLKMIESFESLRLTAYMPTPHDVPTIGYGHTDGVKMGDTCTNDQAEQWLEEDLRAAELAVEVAVSAPLNQNQFDALVSFVFNVGAHAFHASTLLRSLNQKDYAGAARSFLAWVHQGAAVLPGLVKRREAERALFEKPC